MALLVKEAKAKVGDMLKSIYKPCMVITDPHGKVLFLADNTTRAFPELKPKNNIMEWVSHSSYVGKIDVKDITSNAKAACETLSMRDFLMQIFDRRYISHLWHITLIPYTEPSTQDLALIILGINVDFANESFGRDTLTGCYTRQMFMETAKIFLQNEAEPFFAFLDIDSFKGINDTYGHNIGDEALIQTVKFLRRTIRQNNAYGYVGRYGGDEFAIVLQGKNDTFDIRKFGSDVSHGFEMKVGSVVFPIKYSIGIVKGKGQTIEALTEFTDKKMYEEKRAKKQAVASASQ